MSDERANITGVVLAGGRGRRMGGVDKGLLAYKGRPLVAYALDALRQAAANLLINANRNHEAYGRFGVPVIADRSDSFDGPLAGILRAMEAAQTDYVLTVPCDSPLMGGDLLGRLYARMQEEGAEVCAAHDGKRMHPVFLIAKRSLAPDLERYLASGQRTVETWLTSHKLSLADFSDHPEWFANINTQGELAKLQSANQA
jgi:molybdopterin-guanine dinucleotide biosynthesis protein A